uniref:Uncharacterized protein n=1 Tax=Oncorhynchus kisutch TaxID=8019 RepID=A0A8C7N853_ONCKI
SSSSYSKHLPPPSFSPSLLSSSSPSLLPLTPLLLFSFPHSSPPLLPPSLAPLLLFSFPPSLTPLLLFSFPRSSPPLLPPSLAPLLLLSFPPSLVPLLLFSLLPSFAPLLFSPLPSFPRSSPLLFSSPQLVEGECGTPTEQTDRRTARGPIHHSLSVRPCLSLSRLSVLRRGSCLRPDPGIGTRGPGQEGVTVLLEPSQRDSVSCYGQKDSCYMGKHLEQQQMYPQYIYYYPHYLQTKQSYAPPPSTMVPPSPSPNNGHHRGRGGGCNMEQLSQTNLYIRGLPSGTSDQDLIKLCQP